MYVDHLTEAQKKAYILADNRMAMDAGWDNDLLKVELGSLQEMAYDLSFTGFDEKELASLMGDAAESEDDIGRYGDRDGQRIRAECDGHRRCSR